MKADIVVMAKAVCRALALAALLGAAQAQVGPAPGRAASVPSPATAAERALEPGEVRPERAVVPQIAVPLRREGVAPSSDTASAVAGGVDDSAARCQAQASKAARIACERRLAARAAAPAEPRKRP